MTTHLHHVVTLAGLYVGAIQKRGGPELVVCLLISEATSPMLHLHHILKELKYKGLLSVMNDIVFVLAFFICRLCFGPFLVYHTVTSETSPLFVKVSGAALEVVSVFWFYKIVKIALYKLGGGKQKKQA
mmetsp:Transcript_13066/g.32822  ORF Transcript_13066/g.32822 Transcript_13066/m.32822 type:complete len:129 (-) Transcript_13066:211-597(-)